MQQFFILVVEDNVEMQMLLTAILSRKYKLKIVSTAKEAYSEIRKNLFDLILVDVELPDESGFTVCTTIKMDPEFDHIPFIFLTSHDKTSDVVMGFSLGADDYITKPFIREQFEARISSKLKRKDLGLKEKSTLFTENIHMDLLEQKTYLLLPQGQQEVQLTIIEFRLLKYFLTHQNHVLTREQILNDVWGHQQNVSDRTVDSHIYTLRKKLGPFASSIGTVSGVGYQYKTLQVPKAS